MSSDSLEYGDLMDVFKYMKEYPISPDIYVVSSEAAKIWLPRRMEPEVQHDHDADVFNINISERYGMGIFNPTGVAHASIDTTVSPLPPLPDETLSFEF